MRLALLASTAFTVIGCASAHAQTVLNVTDGASLSAAIAQADSNASASYVINFQNNITLSALASNTLNAFNTTSNVTVNGNGFTLDGGGVQRGFFVYAGTVGINNLTIQNTQALGGSGSTGAGSGGGAGGGLGAGGALFVASGGNVAVSNVVLSQNNATGGSGGAGANGVTGAAGVGGSGGGLGGNGALSGGGGGVGRGADGGGFGASGSPGIVVGAAGGGSGGTAPPTTTGGINGGGGGGTTVSGPGGGGGVGGQSGATRVGGFGGGGGIVAAGGFGGGGGAGTGSAGGNNGAAGGLGGGGGGSGSVGGSQLGGAGGIAGSGGFGAGTGGTGANVPANLTNISGGGGGGGGGGGMGGAVFVQQGGTLTIAGAFSINGSSVAGGAGGSGGIGDPGTGNGTSGTGGSALGSGIFLQGNGTINFQPGSGVKQIISDAITDQSGSGGTGANAGSWGLTKSGAGTLVLSGIDTYTGATTVNGGALEVDGTLTGTSNVAINSGGMLTGTGIIDPLVVAINSGAILAPGNGAPGSSIAIVGNLAFQSGAIYLVQVNPATASFATVTGTATLGGATVNAVFASGSYVQKKYTILTAAGGVSGTFAAATVNTNLPNNFRTSLSYDANDVFLNLSVAFPTGLSGNQQAVGNALASFFNATGSLPLLYATLSPGQLSQASGELGTGSQQTTFDAMGQFTGLLTDPFLNRTGDANPPPGATGYADEALGFTAAKHDAYAMFTKAPPVAFSQRWSIWAAGYGGSQTTSGDAVAGSNNTTSRIFGTAVGADYLFSPNTIAGFALAGGGTNFSVDASGSGRSDLFQVGAYVRHFEGPAYISAAIAYGWQDITTNRTVTIAGLDQLRAEFNANAYSGRAEGGYRFVAPIVGGLGITPYAAGQFTTFNLPSYAESAITGSAAFALAYGAKDVTDARSELGIRTDKSWAMKDGILTLRGRFAWAHDYDRDRAIGATFQALPGASFVVNGAAQAADSALTTASLEMKWRNGWSVATTFEGEFSNVTESYAGKGVVRYAW